MIVRHHQSILLRHGTSAIVWAWAGAICVGTLMLAAAGGDPPNGSTGTAELSALRRLHPLVFTQIAVEHTLDTHLQSSAGGPEMPPPAGSRIVRFDPQDSADGVVELTRGFVAAGRPDVSFDGKHILFVGKRFASEAYQIWEMDTNGSGLRIITKGVGNCRSAIYLPSMYTIDADQPFYQLAFCSDSVGHAGGSLYTCRLDGSRVRQVTFDPGGVSDPFLLSDGRLLFSSWRSVAGSAARLQSVLLTVNTDGTDVFPFAGAGQAPVIRTMPCETPDGRIVYVESASVDPLHGGRLVAVESRRSLHTPEVVVSAAPGSYSSPMPLDDGGLLVSYRPGPGASYGIYRLDPASRERSNVVYDDPAWHELHARELRPRRVPPGRSSVVDDRVQTGLLYCLNAYLTNLDAAQSNNERRIDKVRIFGAQATTGGTSVASRSPAHVRLPASIIGEKLLGEVSVESDGSFYVELPARTPFRLQTVDADGTVLQAMRSWLWVMPKEARGCIGCHEDREMAPPNRHVLALRKPPHRVGLGEHDSRSLHQGHHSTEGRER